MKLLKTIALILLAWLGIYASVHAQVNVNQGGTGKISFPGNSLIYSDASSFQRLQATSSPTVSYIMATSSTATSTFLGGIFANGLVGIGTSLPTAQNANARLTVAGNGSVSISASTTDDTTSSAAIFDAYSPGARAFIGAHGQSQVTTQYGITVGGYAEIAGIANTWGTFNGLLLGTRTTNTPIIFGTNSLERMRILGNGDVGIGLVTPNFAKLEIQGTTTSAGVPLAVWDSASTAILTVRDSGTIGVGTSSPKGASLVIASSTASQIKLSDSSTNAALYGRMIGNSFYMATGTDAFATSSGPAALALNTAAGTSPGVAIGTTTAGAIGTISVTASAASTTPLFLDQATATGGCIMIKDTGGLNTFTELYTRSGVLYSKAATYPYSACN